MRAARVLPLLAVAAFALPALAWHPEWIATSNIPSYGSRSLLNADFNGDGIADVLSRTSYHDLQLSLVQNSVLATPVQVYQGNYLSDAAVADVDGDGKLDVVASDTATNDIVVLRSNGNGTFAAPIKTALPFAPTHIATGDFNGDGKLDLAIQSYSAALVAILLGNGGGTFVETSRYARTTVAYQIVAGDVDHDGHDDVVLANEEPVALQVYYGAGNGTLAAPTTVGGAPARSDWIVAADLDGDGDLELISCEFDPNTVTVVVNLGSRTFASPVKYDVFDTPAESGNPVDFIVGDVTGDGDPDLVVTLANAQGIATFPGQGNGAFDHPSYASVPQVSYYDPSFPLYITAADFTGDGRLDVAVSTAYVQRLVLMGNACGDSSVTVQGKYPTISSGQTATFTIQVRARDGSVPPDLAGNVVLKDGAATIGTAAVQDGQAVIDVVSLPVGTHAISASFDGDDLLRPSVSSSIPQKVVATPTTVTLVPTNTGGQEIPYGRELDLGATVTSDIPGDLTGSFWLYTDGHRSEYTQSQTYFYVYGLTPGTHTLYVQYEGNATHPPAQSNVVTQVVRKGQVSLSIDLLPSHVQYGSQPQFRVWANSEGGQPQGNLRLYEGTTLLLTKNLVSSSTYVDMPLLDVGVHYLHLTYEGDQNYEPAESSIIRFTVLPTGPLVLDVYASGSSIQAWGWFQGASDTHFVIWRRIGSGNWTVVSSYTSYPSWPEYSPQPGTVYAFRIEAYSSANQLIATSNVDLAMLVTFADDPLQPLMPVRAQHVQELVNATNVVRTAAGLSAFSLADAAAGHTIRAWHIESLRNALNEGRAVFGVPPIELSPPVAVGTPIRMKHVQDLRDGFH